MKLAIYKIDGTTSGKEALLDDSIFGIEPNDHAIYLDVKQFLANQRQGTHKTKDRSEVAYSTKKMGKQKGGGGARHGSIKSNIYVGGGRVFGPKPHDYSFKLNKKLKQLARYSALSYKVKDNAITMIESFSMEAPKTKEFIKILDNLKVNGRKTLVVLPENSNNIYLSSRNLPEINVITVDEINTYTIMNANHIVLVDGVQDILVERRK
ncbi:MAG: 50S ribosomal protein L4 [Bacteroidales bacterium]|nr:50S ribosomal protein L4 [Bacteroidales bacterium]MDD4670029.1 50S ribosomal protein L4 [Bacteroidales bacterium]